MNAIIHTRNPLDNDGPDKVRSLIEDHTLFPHWLWCTFTYYPNVIIPSTPNFYINTSLNKIDALLHPITTSEHLRFFLQCRAKELRTHLHVAMIVGEHLHTNTSTYHYHALIGVQRKSHIDKTKKALRNKFYGNTWIKDYEANTIIGKTNYADVEDTYHANCIYYALGKHNQVAPSNQQLNGVYCGHSKRCTRRGTCSFTDTSMFIGNIPQNQQSTHAYSLSQRASYYHTLLQS